MEELKHDVTSPGQADAASANQLDALTLDRKQAADSLKMLMEGQNLLAQAMDAVLSNQEMIINEIKQNPATTAWTTSSLVWMITLLSSFEQNETLLRQNLNWERFGLYRYIRQIHDTLPLYDVEDTGCELVRIGRNHDGGYRMIKPFSDTPVAYSIGICDDVSWDVDMAREGCQIWQYDHTIVHLPEENPAFHWEKIGLAGKPEPERCLDTLENLIRKNGHSGMTGMVLKMDIEGAEWDVFDGISEETLNQFDQIVVEVHNLTLGTNRAQILRCFQKLSRLFALVHVHGNNNRTAVYCKDFIMPDVLELSFVKRGKFALKRSERLLPDDKDQPNNPIRPDYWLGRWNLD